MMPEAKPDGLDERVNAVETEIASQEAIVDHFENADKRLDELRVQVRNRTKKLKQQSNEATGWEQKLPLDWERKAYKEWLHLEDKLRRQKNEMYVITAGREGNHEMAVATLETQIQHTEAEILAQRDKIRDFSNAAAEAKVRTRSFTLTSTPLYRLLMPTSAPAPTPSVLAFAHM